MKVCNLLLEALVTRQFSQAYRRTLLNLVLKILGLVFTDIACDVLTDQAYAKQLLLPSQFLLWDILFRYLWVHNIVLVLLRYLAWTLDDTGVL